MPRRRIADAVGEFSQRGQDALHLGISGDVGVRGHGADEHFAAFDLDAAERGEATQIDEIARRREPQLHARQQRHAAGQQAWLAGRGEQGGGGGEIGRAVVGEVVHGGPLKLGSWQ